MELMNLIQSAGGLGAIAKQVGISESQAQTAASALLPAIVGGFKKACQGGGVEGLTSMLASAGGASLLDNVLSDAPTQTSLGQNVLGQIFGSKEVSREVASQAAQKTGLSVDVLKQMLPLLAMLAAGMLSKQSGQAGASQGGGLLGQLGGLLGGGGQGMGGLGKLLDADGDGNPLDDVMEAAGKLFKR